MRGLSDNEVLSTLNDVFDMIQNSLLPSFLTSSSSSSCSPVNPMVTMRLKYDVFILVCHVRCPSLHSCSVVNNSGPLVYYWSTSCMDDLCCVFPVYSNCSALVGSLSPDILDTWPNHVRRLLLITSTTVPGRFTLFLISSFLSCLSLWHPAFSSGSSFPWSVTSAHLLFSLSRTNHHRVF